MRRTTLTLAVLLSLIVADRTRAEPITYTETFAGSGTFGGASYTNVLVTLVATADTNDVTQPAPRVFGVDAESATVTVTGLGSATISGPTSLLDLQLPGRVGLGTGTVSNPIKNILAVDDPAFSTYDLSTPIGPITGTAEFNSGVVFDTSSGAFDIDSVTGNVATFQATVMGTVPEPSSLALMTVALALAGIGGCRRKRRA